MTDDHDTRHDERNQSVSKKHFIALADAIRPIIQGLPEVDGNAVLHTLAGFCADQNPRFNRERWWDYVKGRCGPSGGAIK